MMSARLLCLIAATAVAVPSAYALPSHPPPALGADLLGAMARALGRLTTAS